MQKFFVCIILVGLSFILSACNTTRFAYPNGNSKFTVLAASNSPVESDNRAYSKAQSICNNFAATPSIIQVDRVPNSVSQIFIGNQVVYITPAYQKNDYMTIMQIQCVPKPVPKNNSK